MLEQPGSALTMEPLQRVITLLSVGGEEAVAVEEVGPLHVDGLEGVAAPGAHSVARGAAGQHRPAALAARHQHRAAQHSYVGVALPPQQRLHHAEEQVLGAQLRLLEAPVAQEGREQGLGVGHVLAVGQQHVSASR